MYDYICRRKIKFEARPFHGAIFIDLKQSADGMPGDINVVERVRVITPLSASYVNSCQAKIGPVIICSTIVMRFPAHCDQSRLSQCVLTPAVILDDTAGRIAAFVPDCEYP